jgi:predicted SnoaL-like aldol condensation-catalyzing enzyme
MLKLMAASVIAMALGTAARAQPGQAERNKQVAIAFYNGLAQGDVEVLRKNGRPDYIQHNPAAATGLEGLIAYLSARPKPATPPPPLEFVRTIAEGDLVFLLRRVPTPTPADPQQVRAVIDIFRVQDGKVAEHWDYFEDFARGGQRGADAPMNSNGVF